MCVIWNSQALPGSELKSWISSCFLRFLSVGQVLSWVHPYSSQAASLWEAPQKCWSYVGVKIREINLHYPSSVIQKCAWFSVKRNIAACLFYKWSWTVSQRFSQINECVNTENFLIFLFYLPYLSMILFDTVEIQEKSVRVLGGMEWLWGLGRLFWFFFGRNMIF